jgi:hypothetical protein
MTGKTVTSGFEKGSGLNNYTFSYAAFALPLHIAGPCRRASDVRR